MKVYNTENIPLNLYRQMTNIRMVYCHTVENRLYVVFKATLADRQNMNQILYVSIQNNA